MTTEVNIENNPHRIEEREELKVVTLGRELCICKSSLEEILINNQSSRLDEAIGLQKVIPIIEHDLNKEREYLNNNLFMS